VNDWSAHPHERIRSLFGKALYITAFDQNSAARKGEKLFLDLGVVKKYYRGLRLNVKDLGTCWDSSLAVDIADAEEGKMSLKSK
jgi:hypothetical protein